MTAKQLFARDDKIRKRCGWGSIAFIAAEFPKRLPAEWRECLKIIQAKHGEGIHMLHIYSVIEAMVEARKAVRRG